MTSGISRQELVSLLAGEVNEGVLAERHGVSVDEVQRWKVAFVHGLKAGAESPVPRRPRARLLVAAAVVLAGVAFAQLTVFQQGGPARASEVNGNFAQLKTWLENKVGTTASNDVTIAPTNKVSFGANTRQMIDLFNSEYGIGVQNSTQYFRTASSGAFAWYAGGTHNNTQFSSGGGTELMRLAPNALRVGGRFMMGASESRLMTLRGTVTPNGTGSITTTGGGFSVSRVSTGAYDITFDTPFVSTPTVLCSANHPNNAPQTGGVVHCTVSHPGQVSTSTFRVFVVAGDNGAQDWPFSFIAVGPQN